MEIQDKSISCCAGRLLTKTLVQVWNLLGNEVAAQGVVQQQQRIARQGGREEHLAHPGMNEGQHASSMGRLQRLGHELRSPHELVPGYECGCHPAELELEWFEEVL